MAKDVDIEVDAREFQKYLRTLDANIKVGVPGIGQEVAEPVAETARALVPRQSGTLASSIRVFGTRRDAGVRAGFKRIPWAGPAHFGHRPRAQGGFMVANPFLYDALDQRRREVLSLYEKRVDDLIDAQTRVPSPNFLGPLDS